HQAVGGICQEIVDRMDARNAVYYPPRNQWNDLDPKLVEHYAQWGLVWGSPSPQGHRVRYSVAFDAHEFVYAADHMLKDAGGRVLVPWGGEARVNRKIDATDPAEVSDALIDCRDMVMNEAGRLRGSVPGFDNSTVSLMADQLGITESRRLQGDYVMTREDLDRRFDDVIARTGHWTKYDCVYNIPYRSLLPRSLDNLLVAGRCISVDHRVHHATKEIPPCMATGEAAGTAAALAVKSGLNVKQLDVP